MIAYFVYNKKEQDDTIVIPDLGGRDSNNSLFTPTGLKRTRTADNRLGLITAPSVRGRAIGPPRKERYHTGSGRQRHALRRQPGFAGGKSWR